MENLEALEKLYNDIENCMRYFKSLKLESSTYGYLLIPLLKEKIPDELNMIISLKFSGNVWTLELMLKYFNKELQAKGICVPFKSTSSEKDKVKDKNRTGYTVSCLHSESYESKSHKRVYCSENHRPSQCKKVTNRQSRINILNKSYRCFLCLKSGHTLKRVLQNIFVENAMENITFLFVTKEKTEIAMPPKVKVRIVLLLLLIRIKVFCYKLHKQMCLTLKLKVL